MIRTRNVISLYDIIKMAYPEYDWTQLKDRKGYNFKVKQVKEIRALHQSGVTGVELAKVYHTNPASISIIVNKRTFKELD